MSRIGGYVSTFLREPVAAKPGNADTTLQIVVSGEIQNFERAHVALSARATKSHDP
jgi:hypothetical protein